MEDFSSATITLDDEAPSLHYYIVKSVGSGPWAAQLPVLLPLGIDEIRASLLARPELK